MANNELHTDECFINSLDSRCECNCDGTITGQLIAAKKEIAELRGMIIRLHGQYVVDVKTGNIFMKIIEAKTFD